MKTALSLFVVAVMTAVWSAGCSSYKTSMNEPDERRIMHTRVEAAIAQFKEEDPTIQRFFDDAYGYAVFPVSYTHLTLPTTERV